MGDKFNSLRRWYRWRGLCERNRLTMSLVACGGQMSQNERFTVHVDDLKTGSSHGAVVSRGYGAESNQPYFRL